MALALAVAALPPATGGVDSVTLSSPDYVLGSTAVVSAAVGGSPPFPNAALDWMDPQGATRRSVTLSVPAGGALADAFEMDIVGTWEVTARVGTITANWTLEVLPSTMSGTFSVNRDMVIGGNAAWVLLAGTTIDLGPAVRLVVQGSLDSLGTAGNPVTMRAAGQPWQGIEVPLGGQALLAGTEISGATTGIEAAGTVTVSGGYVQAASVGLSVLGGHVTLEGVAVTAPAGIFAAGGSVALNLVSITSATALAGTGFILSSSGTSYAAAVAWDLTSAIVTSTGDSIGPTGAQVLLDGSAATLEGATLPEAVSFDLFETALLIGNGTFLGPTAGFSVRGGDATVLQTPWPASGRAIVTDGSLQLRSLLTVEATIHEDSSAIGGAAVSVAVDGTEAWNGTTGPDGRTPPVSLPFKVWDPAPRTPLTQVSVASGDLRFGFNHRTVDLRTSIIESFEGSLADNDLDGEPDFADVDDDDDGLTDTREQQIFTNPFLDDTDLDGLPDYWEWYHDHGATLANSDADLDGDGLPAIVEFGGGTSPRASDTDGDGAGDGWEVTYGFNPNDPADGLLDADADGVSNAAEAKAGTDPRNATSHPQRGVETANVWGLALLAVVGGSLALVAARIVGRRAARRKTAALETTAALVAQAEPEAARSSGSNPFEDLEEFEVLPSRSPILLPIGLAAEASREPLPVPDIRPVPRTKTVTTPILAPETIPPPPGEEVPSIRIVPAIPLPLEGESRPPSQVIETPQPPATPPFATPPPMAVFHAPTRSERRRARRARQENPSPATSEETENTAVDTQPVAATPEPPPDMGPPPTPDRDRILPAPPAPEPALPPPEPGLDIRPPSPASQAEPDTEIRQSTIVEASGIPLVESKATNQPVEVPSHVAPYAASTATRQISKRQAAGPSAVTPQSLVIAHDESSRDLAVDITPQPRPKKGRGGPKPVKPPTRRSTPRPKPTAKPTTKPTTKPTAKPANPARKPSAAPKKQSKAR